MKLTYKGIFKNSTELPKGELPENAVRFDEPDSMDALAVKASLYMIPPAIFIAFAMLGHILIHGNSFLVIFSPWWTIWVGIILSLPAFVLHEILHAVCFGKNAEVGLYIAPKQGFLFVLSNAPISKPRFIFMSLFPNIILGLIPLIIWIIIPMGDVQGSILFIFSSTLILGGAGDYLNSYNAFKQMPKGSIQQLSGMNSYWFMP